MPDDNPHAGSPAVPSFTDQDLIDNLVVVFSEKLTASNAIHREKLYSAFANLVGFFIAKVCPATFGHIAIDYGGVLTMLSRFQRDAYGVGAFHDFMKELETDGLVSSIGRSRILERLTTLGIRINTESPRKTKVAAAFSLWMSVFRPVQLTSVLCPGMTREDHETFCASLNFWISSMYLSLFGSVLTLDADEDGRKRIVRIKHDLTYRALNLSSLEMLYMSLFRRSIPTAPSAAA